MSAAKFQTSCESILKVGIKIKLLQLECITFVVAKVALQNDAILNICITGKDWAQVRRYLYLSANFE